MARVELIIDPLRISRQSVDVEMEGHVAARAIRQKVRSHLLEPGGDVIRVRMGTQAFRFFSDMEGLSDLRVIRVSARGELARKINGALPGWCNDEFIVSCGLVEKVPVDVAFYGALITDLKILYLLIPNLVTAKNPEDLLLAIRNSTAPISQLLLSDAIISHIQEILSSRFEQQEVAYIIQLLRSENFAKLIDSIFAEVVYEKIRSFVTKTKIVLAIPARQIPLGLTSKLMLNAEWWSTIDMAKIIYSLTQRVIQCAEQGQLSADEIPAIILGYDEAQLSAIATALNTHPEFATAELLSVVRSLGNSSTLVIENVIESFLQVSPPPPLEIHSSAKEAMDWGKEYLKYAATSMKRGSEPNSTISKSFSDWISIHPSRLNNSQWNWRAVSTSVQQAIEAEKMVVLLVVDAFGAILTKELIEQLYAMDEALHIEERVLFAPLPTITEIGKLAVATGKDVHKLSGDTESSLRGAYARFLSSPDEFQFQKGWTSGAKAMAASTRLLVFFENQLDDQLHECLNYADLDAQLKIVYAKVGKLVKQWVIEARSRSMNFEIFVTADHGLAKIENVREFAIEKSVGAVGERYVRLTSNKCATPQDFYRISAEGAPDSCYLIPQNRVRLLKRPQPFVHGGMTAEEVLIPLISIRPLRESEDRPIVVRLAQPLAPLYGDGWSLQIHLHVGSVPLRNFTVRSVYPFEGELKFNALEACENVTSILHLRATIPQEGTVSVVFSLRYLMPNATTYTVAEVSLDVTLQPRVLIRGQGAIDFDNMFD